MHYGFSEDKTDCYFACIVFRLHLLCTNPELTEKYIHPIAGHPNLPYIYLHADNPAEAAVIRHFDAACEDCRRHYEGYELMMISRLTAAWAALYSLLSPDLLSYSTAMEEDLSTQRNMISFIYRNYTQKLSLNDIAAAGSICRSKCCRIFKKYLNKNAHRFSERLPPGGQYAPADRYRHEHHRDRPVLRLPEPQLLCGNLPAAQRLYPQPLPYAAGRGI